MWKPIPSLLFTMLLFAQSFLYGQDSWQYSPIKDDEARLKTLQSEIRKQYEKDSVGITGENKKYVLEIYQSRFKSLNELFTDKEAVTSPEANAYINAIANEIISKNPELKKIQPRVFFSRAWWPNAYTTGEGTVVFNIDLFIKLQNESQVAFVMCHELAHQYLEHSNKKINKYITTIYSREFQEKLKELRKQKYDKKDELDKLEKGFAFNIFRHSREYETEADSIGLHFMKNTRYDCKEALSCLALLDEIDEEKMDYSQQLPKVFNFNEYPFRKRWIEKETAFLGVTKENNDDKKLEDSLKTHPDCKLRVKILEPIVQRVSKPGAQLYLQGQQQFTDLQKVFSFEEINHCFTSKKLSLCLFNSVKLMDKYPQNAYLAAITGKCFNEFYEKQKGHHLNNIVDNPSPFREKNYNTLLEFISKLSLNDIGNIGYQFMKQHSTTLAADADFSKAFEQGQKNYNEIKGK